MPAAAWVRGNCTLLVADMTNITIQLELNPDQAKHYLAWLNSQYTTTMADVWYSDRYRNVPCGERAPQVMRDVPHLAGISRTKRELEKKLGTADAERAL